MKPSWYAKRLRWHLRAWWERRRYGYDRRDVWDLQLAILRFTLPRLKDYRRNNAVILSEYLYRIDPDTMSSEEISHRVQVFDALPSEQRKERSKEASRLWDETLDKMIRAIELWLEYDGIFFKNEGGVAYKKDEKLQAEFDEGWELFHKHFFSLWT